MWERHVCGRGTCVGVACVWEGGARVWEGRGCKRGKGSLAGEGVSGNAAKKAGIHGQALRGGQGQDQEGRLVQTRYRQGKPEGHDKEESKRERQAERDVAVGVCQSGVPDPKPSYPRVLCQRLGVNVQATTVEP